MNLGKYKRIVFSLAASQLFLVGLFLLLNEAPQIARAAPGDLFVTPGGGGDCSQGNPCDLQTALTQAVDGDTLYLAQGSYTGTGGPSSRLPRASPFTAGGMAPQPRPLCVTPTPTPPHLMARTRGGQSKSAGTSPLP